MKTLNIIFTGLLMCVGLLTVATPAYAASSKQSVCEGIGLVEAGSGNCSEATGRSVTDIVRFVIGILSYVIGAAAVIMVLVAGFKYITAQGDSNAISSAKTTLTYAIVGLLIAALAQVIVRFVFTKATT